MYTNKILRKFHCDNPDTRLSENHQIQVEDMRETT